MQEKRWNGQDLAAKSCQKSSDIYNILSGKSRKPSADKIEAIARAFGVSTSQILYGTKDKPTSIPPDEEWDGLLYNESMNVVRDAYRKRGIKFKNRDDEKNTTMRHTLRVYNYAKKRKEITADPIFAEDIIIVEME
jgi:transcriptional regulator with XRE-family HTH domain